MTISAKSIEENFGFAFVFKFLSPKALITGRIWQSLNVNSIKALTKTKLVRRILGSHFFRRLFAGTGAVDINVCRWKQKNQGRSFPSEAVFKK
jgi:hypothetical protein